MTHEFKHIVEAALLAKNNNLKSVLASVVALDGSSYRRPGVRMLLLEDGTMIGAVSGGCVEKEINRQAASVFKTGVPKMMIYDGRYRLGCEGALYILIEMFNPDDEFYSAFYKCIKKRDHFNTQSHYKKEEGEIIGIGSVVHFDDVSFYISKDLNRNKKTSLSVFRQNMEPCFKLLILGSEHDAAKLCKFSTLTGWETTIVSSPSEDRTIDNFPGATEFLAVTPEDFNTEIIDNQTAVVVMTHSFATDLRFLVALKDTKPAYIGLLGPAVRRDDLLSQFFEYCPDVDSDFIDLIHGPAGINIGAETPEEISISILSEILAVVRNEEPLFLSKKQGSIHNQEVKKKVPSPKNIAIILLAAGESKRFGAAKQLLLWKETTLLQHSLSIINNLNVLEKYVVLGANEHLIQSKTSFADVHVLINKDWEMGLGKSIAFGVHHILKNKKNIEGVLLLLADQPLINSEYLNTMINKFKSGNHQIIASSYKNKKIGVPALFDSCYYDELTMLNSDKGAQFIIKKHKKNVTVLSAEDLVLDIDTKEDYDKLHKRNH